MRNLTERFRISDVNAKKLMRLLHSHGIIRQDPEDAISTPQKIITDQLKSVITKFFNTKEKDIVDRLLAETFASQESTPDPIGEVLSPLEKVTLQNTSNIGRVIDNPNINKIANDNPTLKQYREALLTNNLDEPSTDPVETVKKAGKRKFNDENRPVLRTGVRTKRARALPK
ncbi:unnamed protein product [Euphydryas editha]|nr:unnamed protein product [Euphydryas editha]